MTDVGNFNRASRRLIESHRNMNKVMERNYRLAERCRMGGIRLFRLLQLKIIVLDVIWCIMMLGQERRYNSKNAFHLPVF